tara:strand:+ start:469 stop:1374 length:906 start_codon:yes stop_codon:yes gene_type:complete
MKLTKTKLHQLIRESLADYDGYGSPSDDDLEYLNTRPPKDSEKDLLASLSKEEKERAEDVLGWWAKQIDETGRLSGHTGKDGSVQRRLWSDEMLTNPPPGAEPVGLYICELVLEALKGWIAYGDDDLDWKREDIETLIKKFKAILAGDKPEQQPEPEVPEDEKIDPRFANLEFDEALQRYKEGQAMKLTRSKLHQLIREELENLTEDEGTPPIPIEDITWKQVKGMPVYTADGGGLGGDSAVYMTRETQFDEWKSAVLTNFPGSSIYLRWGSWAPAGGPWKQRSDDKQQLKADDLRKWGSH